MRRKLNASVTKVVTPPKPVVHFYKVVADIGLPRDLDLMTVLLIEARGQYGRRSSQGQSAPQPPPSEVR